MDANWISETVVSPATRAAAVSSTRAAMASIAAANRFRLAASRRIEAEKSNSRTTSDRSGPSAATLGAIPPRTSRNDAATTPKKAAGDPTRLLTTGLARSEEHTSELQSLA